MNETVNAKYTNNGELVLETTYEAIEATIKSLRSLWLSSGLTKKQNRLIYKLIGVLEEALGDGVEPSDDPFV
jgi:hypothetical protein